MQLTKRFATVICLLIFGILVGRHTNTLVNFSYTLLSSSLIAWLDNTAMSKDCIPKRNKSPPTLLYYPWKKNIFILGVKEGYMGVVCFGAVQPLSCVWLFATLWTAACQASWSPCCLLYYSFKSSMYDLYIFVCIFTNKINFKKFLNERKVRRGLTTDLRLRRKE